MTTTAWRAVLFLSGLAAWHAGPACWAASVTVALPTMQGAPHAEVRVPIQVRGAQGLGPFQMELCYDPKLLEAKTVTEGDSFPVGLFDFHVIEPGRLRVVMTGDPSKPVTGDGTLLIAIFQVLGEPGKTCALTAENARAWEQTPQALDMRLTVEPGRFTVTTAPGVPLWIWPAAAGALIAMLILLRTVFARKKP